MKVSSIQRVVSSVLIGGLLTGCRPAHDHPHDDHGGHDHEHEERTAQITVWQNGYEVFAEHKAPAVDKITTFITHVTDLQTLEPRRERPVKFVIKQGESVFEHPQPQPARAGIYLPGIAFPKAGDWQVTLLIPAGGTNATVELGTVKVYADAHDAAHAEFPEAPQGVSFLKEQQWKILSQTEPVTKRHLVERIKVAAQVAPKPGQSVTVSAPVSGQLIADSSQALPQMGQKVEAGQLLGLLRPNFSEASASLANLATEFANAKAALTQAEATLARTKKLAASEAKSARELQDAELSYQAAEARYAALSSVQQALPQTNAGTGLVIELRAPITGILNEAAAGVGDVVSTGQSLFTVLNPDVVRIEAHLPEASVSRLSSAKDAAVELAGRFLPVTGNQGRLISLGLAVDPATRTVPLVYEVANPNGLLRIGQHVHLHVETAQADNVVAVPDSALVEEGGQLIAFVQLSGETFEKREVKVGIHDTGYVQILEGIQEGERVVTKGAYAIRLSSISGVIPAHGHAH